MSSEFIKNLVVKAQNGSADSFGELYEIYSDDLFRFAYYYTNSPETAEDCVSEAVCIAFSKIASLKKAESFKSWMFKILHNCCKNAQKQKLKERGNTEISEVIGLTAEETHSEELSALWKEVNKLSKEERELIVLYYIFGYSSKEISEITGLKDATIRSKISRTILKLQKILVK